MPPGAAAPRAAPPRRAGIVGTVSGGSGTTPPTEASAVRIDPVETRRLRVRQLEREAAEREARWREEHPEEHAAVMRQLERVRAGETTLDEALLALGTEESR